MAAGKQIVMVQAPRARRSVGRRLARSARRAVRKGGVSIARLKEKQTVRTLGLGGMAALGFGILQKNVKLPGLEGVPNSLTYGTVAVATGVIAKSDVILKLGTGPFFAGLHNIGLKGIGKAETLSGEDDDATEGESAAGEFEDVAAGEFDDV